MKYNLQAANSVVTEGPATPMKINLQLFAEGDPAPEGNQDPAPGTEPPGTEPPPSDEPPAEPTLPNDPTPPPTEPTQTQAFARRLKEETQRAIDAEYDRLYGAEYGIHSKADYDRVIAEQKAAEEAQKLNIDPAFYNEFVGLKDKVNQFETEKQQLEFEKSLIQQDTALKNDPVKGELYKQWENDVKSQAKAIGCDLNTAFLLMLDSKLGEVLTGTKSQAEQAAIQKLTNNANSTPGSLSGGGENNQTFFTKEQVEKMTPDEVTKNYENICKSMKKW
jgi:hypothetical protein